MSLFRRHIFYNKLTNGSTILYTTTDDTVLDVSHPDIVSNIYENGQGVLTFNKKMTTVPHIFNGNNKLKTITFPEECNTFYESAFYSDFYLEELCFLSPKLGVIHNDPEKKYSLWYPAYGDNNIGLKKISSPNNSFDDDKFLIIDSILYCYAHNALDRNIEYTLPYNIHSISAYAMVYNDKIKKLTIPDSVKYIYPVGLGDNVVNTEFYCNIPNNIIYIGIGAFRMIYENINTVENLNIPATCEYIGNQAFMRWNNLKTLHFYVPSTGLKLQECPFEYCSGITDVYCHTEFPPTCPAGDNIFGNYGASDPKLHIPIGTKDIYIYSDLVSTASFNIADIIEDL